MNDVHVEHEERPLPEALAGVDLNLLVAFDALTREVSVTRAAARVGLTQSAMSHALRRLRDLLGDPVLVRGRSGMILTPRAEAIAIPMRSGLSTLHRALRARTAFDAATSQRTFRFSSPDLFDVLVLPRLLETAQRDAPGLKLVVAGVSDARLEEQLETGELDLAIVPRLDVRNPSRDVPSGLVRRTLFRDHLLCLMRANHPALAKRTARGKLPLREYARLSHVMISPSGSGSGPVDEVLAERGLHRRIALRVPGFYAALAIVARSDLVLTGPSGLLLVASPTPAIVSAPPPLRVPGHAIDLVWHTRFTNDPGHTWLRDALVSATTAILG